MTPSGGGFDLANKEKQIAKLDAESGQPGFWDDQQAAQRKTGLGVVVYSCSRHT